MASFLKKSFITLIGIFLKFIYISESFCVFLLKPFNENVKIKAVYYSSPESFFIPGARLLLTGVKENNRYGEQFTVYVARKLPDHFGEGLIEFLVRRIKGIGAITARRLAFVFGEELKKVLDEFYKYELELKQLGITEERLRSIVESWEECRKEAEVLPYLCDFGLTANQAERVLASLGAGAIEKIKRDPYVLTRIKGFGFIKADRVAHKIGKVNERQRLEAAVLYTLREASTKEGHCFLTLLQLKEKIKQFTNMEVKSEDDLIEVIKGSSGITPVVDGNGKIMRIYLNRLYESVTAVTEKLLDRAYTVSPLRKEIEKDLRDYLTRNSFLTDMQKTAVLNALTKASISYITGLPGTGKTTTVRELVAFLKKREIPFILLAPTGKAAKRLEEQVGEKASTIHRALCFKLRDRKEIIARLKETETLPDDLSVFLYPEQNQENPLPAKVIIVDEASMIDIFVFELLLNALRKDSLLILIGDADQLPSVGPGQVLKDIVNSKDIFCGTVLTDIMRQSKNSGIVNLAHMVHRGQIPYHLIKNNFSPYNDVKFIKKDDKDYQGIIDEIIRAIEENDDRENIQVVSCMHKGKLGTKNLNKVLKSLFVKSSEENSTDIDKDFEKSIENDPDNVLVNNLINAVNGIDNGIDDEDESKKRYKSKDEANRANKDSKGRHENVNKESIEVGERIIQIENNYTKMVFNGETGKVIKADGRKYTVEFDDKVVDYTRKELISQTELAYCLTVHKTQGSEYGTVIMPLTTSHYILLSRNLLYTAITRAKKRLHLIGSLKAFAIAVKNPDQRRNSCIF